MSIPALDEARDVFGGGSGGSDRADDLGATHGQHPRAKALSVVTGITAWAIRWYAGWSPQTTSGRSVGLMGRGSGDGRPMQPGVDAVGGGSPLGDRPHDQRLATTGVAGDEDARNAGHGSPVRARCSRARRGRRRVARRRRPAAGRGSPWRAGPAAPAAHARCPRPSRTRLPHPHLVQAQAADLAVVVPEDLAGRHGIHAVRRPPRGRRRCGRSSGRSATADCRAGRPGLGHDLQAGHRPGTLPVRGADAVGAGVPATDDDDVLAGRR
jgi:hypothetical protein